MILIISLIHKVLLNKNRINVIHAIVINDLISYNLLDLTEGLVYSDFLSQKVKNLI